MDTGRHALIRAGDATVGILVARGSGLTMLTLSQVGRRAMASRGTLHGTTVHSCLALLSPAGLSQWRQTQWTQQSRLQSREATVILPPWTSLWGSSACWYCKATPTPGRLGWQLAAEFTTQRRNRCSASFKTVKNVSEARAVSSWLSSRRYMELRIRPHWRSLSLLLMAMAVYMVHALSLQVRPLVRLVMWLLISFMATVFYKKAMVWLGSGYVETAFQSG